MNQQANQELTLLRKKVRRQKIFSIFLIVIILIIGTISSIRWIRDNALELGLIDIDEKGPFYKQIKEIMSPIRYSGLMDFLDPKTRLTIDFEHGEWTIHNIHHFDERGRIVLKEGRYGLCGDLAVYMYEKILSLFDDRYSIEFIQVAESNFFPLPNGSHIVLKVTDNSFSLIPNEYILDPSFRKYRRIEYFDDYVFFAEKSNLKFYEEKNQNEIFRVDTQSPIFIKKDFIIGFAVNSVEGKFDRDNFAIFLNLTRRHRYFSRPIFSLRKKNGVISTLKNDKLALKVLKKNDFDILCKRISSFFESI